jgi:hypothetical protein
MTLKSSTSKDSDWSPLPEKVVAYETSIECAAKLRLAHSLVTEVVSNLRLLEEQGGHELFEHLVHVPREIDKAQQSMVTIYRELRRESMEEPEPKKAKLVPPDRKRCQADIPGNGPFTMGGEIGDPNNGYRTRCKEKPMCIATEKVPGPDGVRGSMSLCDHCRQMMEMQMPGACTYRLIKAQPRRKRTKQDKKES